MRYLKIAVIALTCLIVCAAVFLVAADRLDQPSAPNPTDYIARAKHYDAQIKRDTFGVPHVFGPHDTDVAFGFAYAHAEDDFPTIQEVALAVRGQLAATQGRQAAVTDYLVRLFRIWETMDAKYETDIPPDVRKVLEAYADGVNYYAALHPDKVTRGLLPFTGKDVAAGFVFKLPFFYGLDRTLRRLTSDHPESKNESKDDKAAKSAFMFPGGGLPVGSNAVAVAASRSSDETTRLLVNSHQPYTGPVAWYEAVLDSGEGWHVAGGFFPGSPFMLHGHNAHLGWANTVNEPDLVDVYKLTLNPSNPNQYRLDGQWRDFEKSVAKLRVKIWGPFVWTAHRDVLWSAHGPVLKTDRGAWAIRFAGMNEVRAPIQYFRLNKASNIDEFRAAMRIQALPSINFVYADEKGNIGYVYNGTFPVRKEGFDWQSDLPGDRSDLIWHAYMPFEKVPQIWNPPSGLVFNSNNTPFRATDPADDMKAADYPATMGIQSNMTNRAWRATETFGQDKHISEEAFRKYKFDLAYSDRSDVAKVFREVLAFDPGNDATMRTAQDILRHWDHVTNMQSRGAALAILTCQPVIMAQMDGRTLPVMNAFRDAIKTLQTHFRRLDPEWGEVNRFRRGKIDIPIDGGPDTYRAVYGEKQPDGTLTAMAGDTLIMFVSWDKMGNLSSESIHQFGSATLNQNSPHYADQVPLFVKMKTKPVLFTPEQLAGHIERDYRP